MPVVEELDKIKCILQNVSNVVYPVAINVKSYKNVLDRWLSYKNFTRLHFAPHMGLIRDIFRFHRGNLNHVIVYFSRNMIDCLLMCRIKGKYVNILTPAPVLRDKNCSLIAVFT
jgi:hypothetical protein